MQISTIIEMKCKSFVYCVASELFAHGFLQVHSSESHHVMPAPYDHPSATALQYRSVDYSHAHLNWLLCICWLPVVSEILLGVPNSAASTTREEEFCH